MDHAGNFPVSNGGVQLGQYEILRILHNLIQRFQRERGMSWLVRTPSMGPLSTGGKAKYDSSDPRL